MPRISLSLTEKTIKKAALFRAVREIRVQKSGRHGLKKQSLKQKIMPRNAA